MSKVVVIGAGASGIIASLKAKENNDVILIDGNNTCGKKILVTGNGKCNYWNSFININNYYTDNYEVLESILKYNKEVLNYLYSIGIYPKIKNNYYYPLSGTSSSIKEILNNELKRNNIKVLYNTRVINVDKKDNLYYIETNNELIKADKVIVSTGSMAYSKFGSDGFGYEIAQKFNHKINPVLPALVSLNSNDSLVKNWHGIRCDVKLSLIIDNKLVKEESGEIQLTDKGISGICTFNISSLVSKSLNNNKDVIVNINFVPSIDNFKEFFIKRNKELKNRNIYELLESILNYKLIDIILKKSNINKDVYWNNLSNKKKEDLINNIVNFKLHIDSTNTYEFAQVCTGGISLNEINNNMESIYNKNLYFTGEVLDVDGICGGFNLAFAFITGYIAGSSV